MKGAVLFVDCDGSSPLPKLDALRLINPFNEVISVSSISSALAVLHNHKDISALVSNHPDFALFSYIKTNFPGSISILVTSMIMDDYSRLLNGQEDKIVDHIIANKSIHHWTLPQLRVTLSKISSSDIFGIEKYLAPQTKIHQSNIITSTEREVLNHEVMSFAHARHLGQHISRMAFGITEELLMNAIFDAPAAAGLKSSSKEEPTLLRYACDSRTLAISTIDPFGALKREKLFSYIKKVLKRTESEGLIDNKKSGAGLGLFKVLYSCHSLVCNIKPKQKTEIMALIDLTDQLRDFSSMPRSVHYFESI